MLKRDVIMPEFNVKESVFARAVFESWPKKYFNVIDDVEGCKSFYNNAFEYANKTIETVLTRCHPAGWVLEGYKQLEMWSIIYFHDDPVSTGVEGPANMAPVGRYGWRFVIEKSLDNLSKNDVVYEKLRPTKDEILNVFSLLCILSYASEFSNLIHYLPRYFNDLNIKFGSKALIDYPEGDTKKELEDLLTFTTESINWEDYPTFAPTISNEVLFKKVNSLLLKHYQFDLEDIKYLVSKLYEICFKFDASILVMPYSEAVFFLSEACVFTVNKMKIILDFILLDTTCESHVNRNFLQKSQQNRMINYCIAYIDKLDELEAIYDKKSAANPAVVASSQHIIISPLLITEWMEMIMIKLLFGQRIDLKQNGDDLKNDLSSLEDFYHKGIFENGVKNIVESKGYNCINLNRINKVIIPCGEIDIIAYHPKKKRMLIVESKNTAHVIDAKGLGQIISDHFRQKKYHEKFLKKIDWVKSNVSIIEDVFLQRGYCKISDGCSILPIFVTSQNSILKKMIKEYDVVSFNKLINLL